MSDQQAPNDIVGKKVFFLYPPSVIQNEMVTELYKNEYEVFLLKNHQDAKRLLGKYFDAILFINIDDGLKEADWEKYIKEIQADEKTKDVRIGITTYNNDPELAKKYLIDLSITAGFIKLSIGLKDSTATILKTLEANEAKGRRKYVRARCVNNATLNYQDETGKFQADIMDMSSAGFAAAFALNPGFKVHSMLKNTQLRLKGILVTVSCIIMGSRVDEDGKSVYVLLFDPKTEPEPKQKVRTFINQTLHNEIMEELKSL